MVLNQNDLENLMARILKIKETFAVSIDDDTQNVKYIDRLSKFAPLQISLRDDY